jgi:glycosyltransferase involved in cell wall biosynthesis
MGRTITEQNLSHRDTPRQRLRILLVASLLDRTDVSEAKVAAEIAARIVKRHDVTILTYHKRDRAPALQQFPEARVIEWQEWPLVGRAPELNNVLQPSYLGFYVLARRWIRQAIARGARFDVVHQLTPMALRYPSPAAGLVSALVIGPMAGALPTPPGFASEMEAAQWYTRLRALDQWRFRHDPLLRRSFARAAVVIGAAPYVRDVLADVPIRRFEVMSELGVDELPPLPSRRAGPAGQLKALFVGRIIRSKGVRDAVRSLAALPELPQVTLDIAGDGEDRAACEAEATRLGITDRVRFHGWLPRLAVDELYRGADAFLFPSFREPTGGAVIEAMSYGLPSVVADYGGPPGLVGAAGIRVAPVDPRQYAASLADALRRLACDPKIRESLGEEARRRVRESFSWSSKVTALENLYDELLEEHAPVDS